MRCCSLNYFLVNISTRWLDPSTFYGETCIAKLGFRTNFGKRHGPFGQGGGMKFTVPVQDGRIVGFFGQSDSYLNAIGVYI